MTNCSLPKFIPERYWSHPPRQPPEEEDEREEGQSIAVFSFPFIPPTHKRNLFVSFGSEVICHFTLESKTGLRLILFFLNLITLDLRKRKRRLQDTDKCGDRVGALWRVTDAPS